MWHTCICIYACIYKHIIDIAYISKNISAISKECQQIKKKKIKQLNGEKQLKQNEKKLEQPFYKRDYQHGHKYMKIYSTWLVIMEMQIKKTM